MRRRSGWVLAAAVGGALASGAFLVAARAATVHYSAAMAGQLKTPEASQYWQSQMAGKPGPDRLGVRLPPGLTAKAIAALLLPPGDHATPTLVGAKPWPGQRARLVAIVCTGGGSYNTALYLFAPEGERLRPVLATPMSSFRDIAGEWHKNGTRDHTITDESNIVIVTGNLTAGHCDLLVKARDWNPVKRPWPESIGVGATVRRAGRPPFAVTLRRQLITLEPSPHLRFRWSAPDALYRAAACSEPCL